MKVVVWALMVFFMLSSVAVADTVIEKNGFYIEGLGYIDVTTVLHKNPWGIMTAKTIGVDEKGNLYDLGGGNGEGWINGAFKGSVAGVAQGAGVATGMALLRPSDTNVNNSSGSGDAISATGGNAIQAQGQGQLQGQYQTQRQTISNKKCGGWIPPGHNK